MYDRNIEIGNLVRVTCGDASPWSEADTQTVSIVIGRRLQNTPGRPPFNILKVYCLSGTLWGAKERWISQHWFEVISEDQ